MGCLLIAAVFVIAVGMLLLIRNAYLNNESVEAGFNSKLFGFSFKTKNPRKQRNP